MEEPAQPPFVVHHVVHDHQVVALPPREPVRLEAGDLVPRVETGPLIPLRDAPATRAGDATAVGQVGGDGDQLRMVASDVRRNRQPLRLQRVLHIVQSRPAAEPHNPPPR
jgi:hypothetical protein